MGMLELAMCSLWVGGLDVRHFGQKFSLAGVGAGDGVVFGRCFSP
jgi:hypothetical protein